MKFLVMTCKKEYCDTRYDQCYFYETYNIEHVQEFLCYDFDIILRKKVILDTDIFIKSMFENCLIPIKEK